MGPRSLGIDIGTTTVSLVVWDVRGERPVRSLTVPLGAGPGPEHDPEVVRSTVTRGIEWLGRELGGGVRALACTGQMHGVLPLDGAARPS